MKGEFIFFPPLGVKLSNDKTVLMNIANNFFGKENKIESVVLVHIYVFGTGDNIAILCYRKDSDNAEFYRGGMVFNRCDVDTEEKARDLFYENEDLLSKIDEPYINRRKPLLLESNCLKVTLDC